MNRFVTRTSTLSLPSFTKKPSLIFYYPIALTCIGALIHSLSLLGIKIVNAPLWLHLMMLTVDIAVIIGLNLRSTWGYWLAMALYVQQVTYPEGYWAIVGIIRHWDGLWVMWLTLTLCIIALGILISRRQLFIAKRRMDLK